MTNTRRLSWLIAVALAVSLAGCGAGSFDSGSPSDFAALNGKSIGVAALDNVSSLELRYLLHEVGSLNASAQGGDVTFVEMPGDSLPDALKRGDIDAALLPPQIAFGLRDDEAYRVLSHVSKGVRDRTGEPALATVLVAFRDGANANPDALEETKRLLKESVSYFEANERDVLDAVIRDQQLDPDYVRWQSPRQRAVFGVSSKRVQEQLLDGWDAAVELGDIKGYPALSDALFSREREQPRIETGAQGERMTISIAVLDDATRRGALYAIEQGIVRSGFIDLDTTYLPLSGLSQATGSREYDIIEASPLVVPTARDNRLDLIVLSGGVQDLDSTLLFVLARPRV